MSAVHIFYGHAKRRCPERPRCMYCNKRRVWMAFTYFGAPVCRECWDGTWRESEEGECDPPFDAITREQSGEWLQRRAHSPDAPCPDTLAPPAPPNKADA